VVSVTDSYGRILGFLDRTFPCPLIRYFKPLFRLAVRLLIRPEKVSTLTERQDILTQHSSTSHRLFLPICLMYYYSLQIKMGFKNKNKQKNVTI
jgi:hypothetical protein